MNMYSYTFRHSDGSIKFWHASSGEYKIYMTIYAILYTFTTMTSCVHVTTCYSVTGAIHYHQHSKVI